MYVLLVRQATAGQGPEKQHSRKKSLNFENGTEEPWSTDPVLPGADSLSSHTLKSALSFFQIACTLAGTVQIPVPSAFSTFLQYVDIVSLIARSLFCVAH